MVVINVTGHKIVVISVLPINVLGPILSLSVDLEDGSTVGEGVVINS